MVRLCVLSLLLVMACMHASAEMRVIRRDGRVLTLDVHAAEIRSIEFGPSTTSGGANPPGPVRTYGTPQRPPSSPGGSTPQPSGPPPSTGPSSYAGRYNWGSNGILTIEINGNQVRGRYTTDNGEIIGTLNGNIFEGYWIEDSSAERCGETRNGRVHWGRLRFEFGPGGFHSADSYCEKPLGAMGPGGSRIR